MPDRFRTFALSPANTGANTLFTVPVADVAPQTRFPDPPQDYDPRAFAEMVRQLEQIVLQLNSSYQQDNKDEVNRRTTFFATGGTTDA